MYKTRDIVQREAACGITSVFGYGAGVYALMTGATVLGAAGIAVALVLHAGAVVARGD